MTIKLIKGLGSFFPSKLKEHYKSKLQVSGLKVNPEKRLGISILIFIALFAINVFTGVFLYPDYIFIGVPLGIFILPLIIMVDLLLINFKIEDRRDKVESVLPDFLHIVSSSLRAGLTPFQALKSAARPEFGPLRDEIEIATTKGLGSGSFEHALHEIKETIDSKLLDRVVNLFVTSLYSGSHMAELMEETANDMNETKSLKKDLTTGTKTYTMFILFTVVIGSPLLFAISIQFISMIEGMGGGGAAAAEEFELGLMAGEVAVSSEFIFVLAMALMLSTSIFSAILMGVISEGNKTYGLRYAPIIAVISVTIFFISRFFVGALF
ncbi:MAG: type II secretion system F family protein [Candidatus Nanoarchaeia archaeon]